LSPKNTFGLWIVEEGEAEGVYTDRREDGVGLFLHASYFNHSCTYVIVRACVCV
jgi:hypothetical protein